MAKDAYQYPKDIKSFALRIGPNDYSGITAQCEIYQDMLTPFWTCAIAIVDTQNYLMNHPFYTGMEMEIEVETGAPAPLGGKKIVPFTCYKISERVNLGFNKYSYTLYGISKEYIQDQKVRVSKSYKGSTASQIAIDSAQKAGINITKSSSSTERYNLIVPNLSPVATVEWCAQFAQSSGKPADFVFYQHEISEYAFKSMEECFNDDSGLELIQKDINKSDDQGREEPENYWSIQNFNFMNHVDSIPNITTGFYGSTVISHDIINKKIETNTYTYGQDVDADLQLKPWIGNTFEGAELTNYSFNPVHPEITEGNQTNNDTHKDWLGSRKSNIMKFETNKLLVDIPGDPTYFTTIGRAITVKLPSHQDINLMDYDELLEGTYLVSAIKHIITNQNYTIHMELAKKRLRTEMVLKV